MNIGELKELIRCSEAERLEFKEWKQNIPFSKGKHSLLGYCVAIGNAGGGNLLIGVSNSGEIVGTRAQININKAAQGILARTGQKITFEEVAAEDKRVLVVQIPAHPLGQLLKFDGIPLMRVGDSLEIMTDEEQKKILLERQADFSAQICQAASFKDVSSEALKKLRALYQEKHSENKTLATLSDEQFLTDLTLLRKGKLTYAGVILLANKSFLDLNFGQAEICFEYRNRAADFAANERKDYREPFVLAAAKIWQKVLARQQVHSFIEGLFRREIPAFNEEVFREALFNAVCHRDYTQQGSIFIKQSPEEIEITNPGGFPIGVNSKNIILVPSTPRNRFLAEVFQKVLPGVERSGQGADKIFRLTITEGKGLPSYAGSSAQHVLLTIPAVLRDQNFVKYLLKISSEKQITLKIADLLLLEKIRAGSQKGLTLATAQHLLKQGLIESYGKTRGRKYVLARRFYSETGKLGERTRRIGLLRDKCKELILEHIRKNKTGTIQEFQQIFPKRPLKDIRNLLTELRRKNLIIPQRKGPNSPWVLRQDYAAIWQAEEKAKGKELILKYLRENKRGRIREFQQIFPKRPLKNIRNLLMELKRKNLIIPQRKGPNSPWVLRE